MNRKSLFAGAVLSMLLAAACSGPSPAELLDQAKTAFAEGEIRTADIHLKNLLREQPDHAEARMLLAEVSLAFGDGIAAESNLNRALELGIAPERVQLLLLRALAAKGEFANLLEQHRAGPVLEGEERVTGLRLVAAAYRAGGSLSSAEATYRQALELAPDSSEVQAELADLLLAAGRPGEARELVGGMLRRDRNDPAALVLRGRLELAASRNETAVATFREVLELVEESSAPYRDALSQLVAALIAQRAVDEAATAVDTLLALQPRNPIARLMKANVEALQGDNDSARSRLETVIAEFPDYMPAHRLLGAINLDQGRVGQARMHLQQAVNANPEDQGARALLAEIYLREGDIDEARTLLAGSTGGAASDAVMLALAGRASLRAGETDRAADLFDQSEENTSADQQQLFSLAAVYVGAGELERAKRVLERLTPEADQRELLLSYLLAVTRLRQGDVEGANEVARTLAEQQPNEPWALNLQGGIALLGEDFEAARGHFTAALEADPNNVQTLLNLARVAAAMEGEAAAAPYLQQALEVDPAQPLALLGLARIALSQSEFDDAREWLAKAPESPQRMQLEGALAEGEGRYADAARSYTSAFEAQPNAALAIRAYATGRRASLPDPASALRAWVDANPQDAQALFVLGGYELETGNQDAAIRHFNAVLASDPDNVPALNNLAILYAERGDDGALELAERAYAAAPENPAVADTVGWLRFQEGDVAGALPLLEQAAAAAPDYSEIRYHLAAALAETGETARAAGMLEAVLAAAGEATPWRADAESRLAEIRGAGE